ncbi:MAG: DUF2167 domain-containing protein [Rhizobacter sp.]
MVKKLVAAVSLALAFGGAAAQAQTDAQRQYAELKWTPPGQQGSLDGKAVFKTSDSYTFLSPAETDKFLKLNGNPPQGQSVTIAPVKGTWFGILRFAPEGYVKDDEKIDADTLLKSLKEQNAAGNEQKKKQGYQTLTMEGWALPPRYDSANKRLEWGTLLRGEDKELVANVSTRILGRSGYTSAVLVTSPETLDADLKDFKTALKDFDYVSGEKYSEWKEGDKVAAYGLGALVLGGAAAVVSSKGGFKVIGLAILGALAAVGAAFKKFFGRKS